ncbi:MAG: ATP-binding protein [Fibrobacterota bacterium]|nr:MAG: ATP-binding protein [Fibrobacterota bacterium]
MSEFSVLREVSRSIEERLFRGKVVVLYGARQVGKTTIAKELLSKHPERSLYLTGDEPDVREAFSNKSLTQLQRFLGDLRLLVLDEAQRIQGVGVTLKLLVDGWPQLQVVATGSSSLELGTSLREPLTGRKFEFWVPPLTVRELAGSQGLLEARRLLEHRMLYGTYPEVAMLGGMEGRERLMELAASYLHRDLLSFRDIRNPQLLEKLIQALALQIGQEVSMTELAGLVGIDKNTVADYLRILQQAFVVFLLPPFARNRRNELKKMNKVYFWDTGMRNAVLGNFQPLSVRSDKGALWENFLIAERLKNNSNSMREARPHFWRTATQQEIDFLEEDDGKLSAFEIKSIPVRWKIPATFVESYPEAKIELVHIENWENFLGL